MMSAVEYDEWIAEYYLRAEERQAAEAKEEMKAVMAARAKGNL